VKGGGGAAAAAAASTSALSQDKRMQIAYNAGLAALLAGQHTAALGCFQARLSPCVCALWLLRPPSFRRSAQQLALLFLGRWRWMGVFMHTSTEYDWVTNECGGFTH
jgi:hypothetical protein